MPSPSAHRFLGRRTFVLGAVAAVGGATAATLAGCTPQPAATDLTPSATTAPLTWDEFTAAVDGQVLRYADPGYDEARSVQNPRFDSARPEGILLAASVADVVAGLSFARAAGVPIALRSGGHSYPGWSAGGADGTDVPPSLVISTGTLDAISVDGETLTVGPGARLAAVYAALGEAGRAIGSGSCGTVGIGGITLGGGVGVLSRSFGLTADQLTAIEIVTADGRVVQADADIEPDLFWASRGGGGGLLGVVTSLTFATQPAPDVSSFSLAFPWDDAVTVIRRWQEWAPVADDRLWSTLKLLAGQRHPSGPAVTVSGTWTGPADELEALLDDFTDPLRFRFGVERTASDPVRRSYADAMLHYAGCASAEECTTAPGGALRRESESATSSIGSRALSRDEATLLVDGVAQAAGLPGLVEGGASLDALGGAVARIAGDATPVSFRGALYTVQYTAVFTDGADPIPFDRFVRGLRSTMTPAWGTGAYVNYADAAVEDPARDYFGANAERLAKVKRYADPNGVFDQPHFV
ncbi:FAD-binding oxidoreductase [Labedella endophytica]|uniref:FAD-binding oxidoreductase n=1 Tax=Labedella endophytica TaxID=1523160 RepID=A0A433JV32_9MICO|nr:FAD-binding oxidoreductase [Labedella endophytica]RUR01912.1 FAD-binding oxidoreductase [Labedella endophytica]